MASQRSRRVTLPGADELFFRPGGADGAQAAPDGAAERRAPKPSGRRRHDEKITVYISSPELLALEQARLALRAEHGVTVDRGRLVREAVAVLLADFEDNGGSSMVVRRLTED